MFAVTNGIIASSVAPHLATPTQSISRNITINRVQEMRRGGGGGEQRGTPFSSMSVKNSTNFHVGIFMSYDAKQPRRCETTSPKTEFARVAETYMNLQATGDSVGGVGVSIVCHPQEEHGHDGRAENSHD